jgi:hypothetical protein
MYYFENGWKVLSLMRSAHIRAVIQYISGQTLCLVLENTANFFSVDQDLNIFYQPTRS